MDLRLEIGLVIAFALVAANLPFVNDRLFVVGPRRAPKTLAWRLVELLCFAALAFAVGIAFEMRTGQRHAQGWQFVAAGLCLFATFAFPGFVWRYLRRRPGGDGAAAAGDG